MSEAYDVLVVGGGHAGTEAAAAAARLGAVVGLVCLEPAAIGRMSCNPAIGGIGKGQLAREIDALGGLMGLAADRAGIQFRMLNTSKGLAVQSPRAQCDRGAYERAVQELLAAQEGVRVVAGEAVDLLLGEGGAVAGLRLADGRELRAHAVILTTGTFLEGTLHTGLEQRPGGRVGEAGAGALGEALRRLGLPTSRLKTGTPPRIARDSVDHGPLREQPGDPEPQPFSFLTERLEGPQLSCWLTRTTPRTHEVVRAHLHEAPMYAGRIEGVGPRYCPSLEDKVVRFADRDGHTVFLEPEGWDSPLYYANGISTSLPAEVQREFVRTIPGLERAEIVQAGYAVEYSFVHPGCLRRTLEARDHPGLYLAGQICGTSGYEEAAAQGIVAGYNAALKLSGREPFVLGRHEAYIGVLIDDLVVSDPREPYRMFTSRAEHRLLLRHDTADRRLTPRAAALGALPASRLARFHVKMAKLDTYCRVTSSRFRDEVSGAPGASPSDPLPELTAAERRTVEADRLYAGYARRQQAWIERAAEREAMVLPEDFDYSDIRGLRNEAREILRLRRPPTLGSASRLAGVSPADLALLEVALLKRERCRSESGKSPGSVPAFDE